MMSPKQPPKPAQKLGKTAQKLWEMVTSDYELEQQHLELLQAACLQLDRAAAARKTIAKDGITCRDRFGQIREHPAVAIERAAQVTFSRLLREMALDIEPPVESRAPRRPGTRG